MTTILTKAKVLEPMEPNRATKLFGGEASGILNWNDIKYPHFYEIREEIRAQFWIAAEVDMTPDVKQFATLTAAEQDAYLKIIGLLATLDAPQTDLAAKLADFTTDPSVKSIMATVADQESEHNHSYAYVLSSVTDLNGQIEAFEMGRRDPVLLKRNERIVEIYNEFAETPTIETALKAMVYTSLLEGMYFYSAFAYFYNLARHNKMVATSTMISFINRDELQHARFISELFRATLAENPEYNNEQFIEWVYEQYRHNVEMEKEWATYVLSDVEGIEMDDMIGYIKYRANKMLRMMGLSEIYEDYYDNPMKWIRAYVDNFDGVKTDFFEQKSRQYTKTSDLNGFDDL
ncbi:ribonucleotide-diphosphate reductase subunit beta [Savagea sp. SN6]|uniref:Ribonucleoside-diphosphate reductase subunit beta n=1 Tax=Savagea serpentis TaxID=2785297 RepID=A0A8J7GM56_9BACL|nr:ribonucleotide-diphosphate reductase subunit beta [Savagea serpentis]MBF4501503.1 ribonucleotide-diphosphate reductase subunit beta [Savagea serpentis]